MPVVGLNEIANGIASGIANGIASMRGKEVSDGNVEGIREDDEAVAQR